MARVNVGVDPKLLTDQWLVAESVEITMITGSLRKNNYQIKSEIPGHYKLGKGHINFFKDKLFYLARRLHAVNKEMTRRGFKPGTSLDDLTEFPKELRNDWEPTMEDSKILRERLIWKLERKPNIWRYGRNHIDNVLGDYKDKIIKSELFYV